MYLYTYMNWYINIAIAIKTYGLCQYKCLYIENICIDVKHMDWCKIYGFIKQSEGCYKNRWVGIDIWILIYRKYWLIQNVCGDIQIYGLI